MASVMGVHNASPTLGWGRHQPPEPAVVAAPTKPTNQSRKQLTSLVEREIIPRLLILHRDSLPDNDSVPSAAILPGEASGFATLPLTLEADALMDRVQDFLDRGVSPSSILVDLLAPSARAIGRLWEEDVCSFVDVTMGLWRLQEVMREVGWRSTALCNRKNSELRSLFTGMPGEQHSFGTLMINELFERDGWRSEALIEPTRRDILARVEAEPFDLVGLTISCDCHSAEIRKLIKAIRSVSHNPKARIMIGGRAVNEIPSLVEASGADGTAPDAKSAVAFAECLVRGTQRLAAIAY